MNDELVKYGKEMISEAITDKGITTSSSDSFDDMATNIRNISTSASGTVGEMNIYCSTTQPTAQNGLWIKRNKSEINNILIKENYYLEDGTAGDLPVSFGTSTYYNSTRYVINACVYNNKLHIYYGGGSSSTSGVLRTIDTKTFEATTGKSLNTSGVNYAYTNMYRYNNITLLLNGSQMIRSNLDSAPDTFSSCSGTIYTSGANAISGCIVGNNLYAISQTASTISSSDTRRYTAICVADITNVATSSVSFTTITYTPMEYINYNKNKVYTVMYSNKLYCFHGMSLVFTFDISTNEINILRQSVTPIGYSSDQSVLGYGFKAGKVFFLGVIGGNIITSKKLTDVVVYDIASNTSSAIKNVFGDDTEGRVSNYSSLYGYCQDENDIYILGGAHTSSSDIKNEVVTKYTIQSNDYDTGTIICQPTAAGDHITNMYSSDLVTLNYGIDAVYYQDTDGFKKQDAAIIKDGVVTDL